MLMTKADTDRIQFAGMLAHAADCVGAINELHHGMDYPVDMNPRDLVAAALKVWAAAREASKSIPQPQSTDKSG
jgi:hypothetical protein